MNEFRSKKDNFYRRIASLVGVIALSVLMVAVVLVWSAQASSLNSLPPPQETINLEFYYSGNDLPAAKEAAHDFADQLSTETGLDITATVQTCEGIVMENLGTGKTDVAPLNSLTYVYGRNLYGIDAKLVNGRFGSYSYKSQINVQTADGYTSIWDLQNTVFAAPDESSSSGYLVPYLMISETTGMTPEAFFSEVNFVGGHPQVIREVYTGTADCGASYYDARGSISGEPEYSDVLSVVSILTTSKPIPNDPWAFYSGLDSSTAVTLTDGIIAIADTDATKDALEVIFGFRIDGVTTTVDSNFDLHRDLLTAFGIDLEPCSPQETINLEFYYDGNDLPAAKQAAHDFADQLELETGLGITATVQTCEGIVMENLGKGKTDVAPLNGLTYVHGRNLYGIDAKLVNGRFGSYSYKSQINVQTADGYTSIWDLQNKKFTFPDPSSRSGYMVPYLMISETTGMTPDTFFSEVIEAGSHPQVIRAVYDGDVDCGGSYYDARGSISGEPGYSDVLSIVSILTTSEPIPNEPWAFYAGLDISTAVTLTDGIVAVAGTNSAKDALEVIFGYRIDGVTTTVDSNFDLYRDLLIAFGIDLELCPRIYLPLVKK